VAKRFSQSQTSGDKQMRLFRVSYRRIFGARRRSTCARCNITNKFNLFDANTYAVDTTRTSDGRISRRASHVRPPRSHVVATNPSDDFVRFFSRSARNDSNNRSTTIPDTLMKVFSRTTETRYAGEARNAKRSSIEIARRHGETREVARIRRWQRIVLREVRNA